MRKQVTVVSTKIYKELGVKTLVNVGDSGEFIGYMEREKENVIFKTPKGYEILPADHLKIEEVI